MYESSLYGDVIEITNDTIVVQMRMGAIVRWPLVLDDRGQPVSAPPKVGNEVRLTLSNGRDELSDALALAEIKAGLR